MVLEQLAIYTEEKILDSYFVTYTKKLIQDGSQT